MSREYKNYGHGQLNIENNSGEINLNLSLLPDLDLVSLEDQALSPSRRMINYIEALIFLIAVLCWWFLLGLFSRQEFPLKRIFDLLWSTFRGKRLSQTTQDFYDEKRNLVVQDFSIQDIGRQEYRHLSREKSETRVLRTLIQILTSGSSQTNQEVEKVLEILQKQEDFFAQEVGVLKKKFDADFEKLQKGWEKFVEGRSQVETDYKQMNQFLNSLVYKFVWSSQPSRQQAEYLLGELRQFVVENPHGIDFSRLETLHNVHQLLNWIAATGYVNQQFQYEFKSEVDAVRECRAIALIIEQTFELLQSIKIKDFHNDYLNSIKRGIENQWIGEILLYGFNDEDLAVIELSLEIDWIKFNSKRNYSLRDGMVRITWNDKMAAEIGKISSRFNAFLESNHLYAGWRVGYPPGTSEAEAERIRKELGFENAPVLWDEKGIEAREESMKIRDLSELGIGLYFKPRRNRRYF